MRAWIPKSVVLVIVLVFGAEVITRYFFAQSLTGRFDYGFHPTAGFEENMDESISLIKAGGRPFRPQTYKMLPEPGMFRIMVFGNSVPYGYYGNGDAPIDEAYPALIAHHLRAEGKKAEGWNLAVGGYGARRVNVLLQQAVRYKPGFVVLHVHLWSNDEINERRRHEFDGWHPKNWFMKLMVVRRLYEAKNERLFRKYAPQTTAPGDISGMENRRLEAPSAENLARWKDQTMEWTAKSIELCRSQSIPIILVSQASRFRDSTGKDFLDEQGLDSELKMNFGKSAEIVSMKKIFDGKNWESLYTDHVHLTKAGHDLLAAEIMKIVLSSSQTKR